MSCVPTLFFSSMYSVFFFFFNDTATTEIYTLSLHDALPISISRVVSRGVFSPEWGVERGANPLKKRSEEHTSELQSHLNLVCRLLLEKKKDHSATAYLRCDTRPTVR